MRVASFVLIAVALLLPACGGSGTSTPKAATKLAVNTGKAPWPTPTDVPERVDEAGLPHSATEYLTIHYHAHLDVFVNGKSEPVAASIGRVDNELFSPLHTHATSGLVHIEAPSAQRITLRQLFTEWGVRLTDECVGGYCKPKTPV